MQTLQAGPYAAKSGAVAAESDEMDVPGMESGAGATDPENVPISVGPTFDDEDDD